MKTSMLLLRLLIDPEKRSREEIFVQQDVKRTANHL